MCSIQEYLECLKLSLGNKQDEELQFQIEVNKIKLSKFLKINK